MDFTVNFSALSLSHFTGSSTYKIEQGGVLVVVNEDGTRYSYAPHSWAYITDRVPDRPEFPSAVIAR